MDVEEQIEKSMQEQMLEDELEEAEAKLKAAQSMLDDVEEGKGTLEPQGNCTQGKGMDDR